MSYSGVKIFTLSEGEVPHLHVGLKGTMNALFLKDLADKPRRGQRGRVEADKSGGGNSYGYDVVKKFDANGEPIRGDRTTNEVPAKIVRHLPRLRCPEVGQDHHLRSERRHARPDLIDVFLWHHVVDLAVQADEKAEQPPN